MVVSTLIFGPAVSAVLLSAICFSVLSTLGWRETRGKHLQYSKLRENTSSKKKVSGKVGMLVCYAPALFVGLSSFYLFPAESIGDHRFTLLRSAITLHFLKRVLEVLFVHKYSGSMDLETMIIISVSYLGFAVAIIFNQNQVRALSEPAIDLKYVGLPIFLVGMMGNFYHHRLLSHLRTQGEKHQYQYKIPRGGLFGLVICPHYTFELVEVTGIACISQTLVSISSLLGMIFYLMARAYATRKWYRSKFDDFPDDVKAVFPYIF